MMKSLTRAAVLCLCSTGIVFAQSPTPELSPVPYGLMGFPYSHAKNDPLVLEKAEAHFQLYELTGARWDRRDFWWSIVQPDLETWQWDYFDRAMKDFQDHRVNLVVILCYGSAWYKDAPATEDEMQRFGEYVYRMVDRYKGWVKHWEVWNEPNILPFWAPKPNVVHYTRLLQIAYQRAKQADPECTILGGALAGADLDFLRGMYRNGARGCFDALSYHTYGNNPAEESQRKEIEGLRAVMEKFGDDKPLWLTETGIYTGPAGVSEPLQAERTVKSEIRWVAMGVQKIFQLTLKDWTDDPNTRDAMSFRGLVHASGEPKPSFYAHRALCEQLGCKTFLGRPRIHPDLHAYLFGNELQKTLVLWADEDQEVETTLDLGVSALLVSDLYGKRRLDVRPDGKYALRITQVPLYLEGVEDKMLLAARTEAGSEDEAIAIGDRADVVILLDNPFDEVLQVEITLQDSPEVRFVEKQYEVELAPGAETVLPVGVEVAATAEPGEAVFQYRLDSERSGTTDLFGRVKLESPYALSFQPFTQLDVPQGQLPLRLTNRSTKDAKGLLEFQFSGDIAGPPAAEVSLPAGEQVDFPVSIETSELPSGGEQRLEARLTADGTKVTAATTLRILRAFHLQGPIRIDGNLDEWAGYAKNLTADLFKEEDFNPNLLGGQEDISASGWVAWDEDALYLTLEVRDDHLTFPVNTAVWDFDSLQVAIDGQNDAVEKESFDKNDFEFEIALMRDGSTMIYATQYPEGYISSVVEEECEVAVVKDEQAGRLVYEVRIPEAVIPPVHLGAGRVMGFSLIHNDNDGGQIGDREGWLELTPGIGYGKEPWQYCDMILWP